MDTTEIHEKLQKLQNLYDDSIGDDMFFFSKLALLELGGWLEESYDGIIAVFLENLLEDDRIKSNDELLDKIIPIKNKILEKMNKNYGFSYGDHLKPLLIHMLGTLILFKIEKQIGLHNINTANSKLSNLYKTRNILAHKSTNQAYNAIRGQTNTEIQNYISSPSVLNAELDRLHDDFLCKLEAELNIFLNQFIEEIK